MHVRHAVQKTHDSTAHEIQKWDGKSRSSKLLKFVAVNWPPYIPWLLWLSTYGRLIIYIQLDLHVPNIHVLRL